MFNDAIAIILVMQWILQGLLNNCFCSYPFSPLVPCIRIHLSVIALKIFTKKGGKNFLY